MVGENYVSEIEDVIMNCKNIIIRWFVRLYYCFMLCTLQVFVDGENNYESRYQCRWHIAIVYFTLKVQLLLQASRVSTVSFSVHS